MQDEGEKEQKIRHDQSAINLQSTFRVNGVSIYLFADMFFCLDI